MSYPRDLDEIPLIELREELQRREIAIREKKCTYCGNEHGSKPSCKMPDMHENKD